MAVYQASHDCLLWFFLGGGRCRLAEFHDEQRDTTVDNNEECKSSICNNLSEEVSKGGWVPLEKIQMCIQVLQLRWYWSIFWVLPEKGFKNPPSKIFTASSSSLRVSHRPRSILLPLIAACRPEAWVQNKEKSAQYCVTARRWKLGWTSTNTDDLSANLTIEQAKNKPIFSWIAEREEAHWNTKPAPRMRTSPGRKSATLTQYKAVKQSHPTQLFCSWKNRNMSPKTERPCTGTHFQVGIQWPNMQWKFNDKIVSPVLRILYAGEVTSWLSWKFARKKQQPSHANTGQARECRCDMERWTQRLWATQFCLYTKLRECESNGPLLQPGALIQCLVH